jgi:HAD superfamily hydrolase (TIGR01509 family)
LTMFVDFCILCFGCEPFRCNEQVVVSRLIMDNLIKCVLFDWGNTLMREFPGSLGPMHLWAKVEVVPGAVETLTIAGQNRIIALATNALDSSEEDIWAALRRVSLDNLIDKVYSFRKIGHLKPSRAFFEYILQDLKIDAQEIVMVGDDFAKDISGANKSGIYSVWLNQISSLKRAGRLHDTIYSLKDLPEAISRREDMIREKMSKR